MRLSNFLEYSFGKGCREEVTRLFSRLELPMPCDGEYSITHDRGVLVFVNPAACVLRLQTTSRAEKRISSQWLLKPLGEVKGNHILAELNPGVRSAYKLEIEKPHSRGIKIKHREINKGLSKLIAEEGNKYWDAASRNLIFLPTLSGEDSFDYPYVVDMDAIEKDKNSSSTECRKATDTPSHQDILYKDLRDDFARRITKGGSLRPFWDRCVRAYNNGILVNSWGEVNLRNECTAAENYNTRLKWRHGISPF